MFGKNLIRENETHLDGQTLAVQEIFYTLQGEGPHSGRPAVFIRLAGCNLACSFCDTDFESNIDHRLKIDQITAEVLKHPKHELVVLTGGEPLRQNVLPLIRALFDLGVKIVQIETAGTLWLEGLDDYITRSYESEDPYVEIVCSPKTPKIHPRIAFYADHFKYVITAGEVSAHDGLPLMATQSALVGRQIPTFRPLQDPLMLSQTIWVSPCDPGVRGPGYWHQGERDALWRANTQAAVQSALTFGYRLSLQIHKLVGLP